MQAMVEHRVGPEGIEDRRRVGEPGGFDDDAAKRAKIARLAPVEQTAQGSGEVLAYGTAQTTAG
jgi:hypothetical protein